LVRTWMAASDTTAFADHLRPYPRRKRQPANQQHQRRPRASTSAGFCPPPNHGAPFCAEQLCRIRLDTTSSQSAMYFSEFRTNAKGQA
jgi:hypothetical protein